MSSLYSRRHKSVKSPTLFVIFIAHPLLSVHVITFSNFSFILFFLCLLIVCSATASAEPVFNSIFNYTKTEFRAFHYLPNFHLTRLVFVSHTPGSLKTLSIYHFKSFSHFQCTDIYYFHVETAIDDVCMCARRN